MEIVFVVTGNVRGWEVSVIMFTSILTVTVGPSARRVRSKSIYRGLMQPLALLKGRFTQITEECSRSEKLFFVWEMSGRFVLTSVAVLRIIYIYI